MRSARGFLARRRLRGWLQRGSLCRCCWCWPRRFGARGSGWLPCAHSLAPRGAVGYLCYTAARSGARRCETIAAMVAMPGEGGKGRCVWPRGEPSNRRPRCGEAASPQIGAASSDQALAGLQFPHEMETALLVSVTSQMWRRNDFS